MAQRSSDSDTCHDGFTPGSVNYEHWGRPELIPLIPEGIRTLLDVGCASGAFADDLLALRPDLLIDGVEPNQEAACVARSRMNSVFLGTFDQAATKRRYDCICFADVLEHMTNPWASLDKARQMLTTGGFIVASIPNVRYIDVSLDLLLRGRFQYAERGVLDRTHLRFFTRSSIISMFESTGYRVQEIVPFEGESERKPFRAASLFRRWTVDLRAMQYGVLATVADSSSPAAHP